MRVPMKASQEFVYAGRRLKRGDLFSATGETDARLLVAIKRAERAPQAAYQTRMMVAAPVVPVVTENPAIPAWQTDRPLPAETPRRGRPRTKKPAE